MEPKVGQEYLEKILKILTALEEDPRGSCL